VAYKFEPGNNKIKLLTEYENVTAALIAETIKLFELRFHIVNTGIQQILPG
jgi:hypothetical protein